MRVKKALKIFVIDFLKCVFYLYAGGLGAHFFMEGIHDQNYIACGACIVLFFALFWALLADRLNVEVERTNKENGKK